MIDLKQLQIGCHVLVEGKMVRVCGITQRKIGYHHPEWRKEAHLCYARDCEVEPILITPELLEKIPFYQGDNGKWYSDFKDSSITLFYEGNRFLNNHNVTVKTVSGQSTMSGLLCLHELEAFIYNTTGINLIPD